MVFVEVFKLIMAWDDESSRPKEGNLNEGDRGVFRVA